MTPLKKSRSAKQKSPIKLNLATNSSIDYADDFMSELDIGSDPSDDIDEIDENSVNYQPQIVAGVLEDQAILNTKSKNSFRFPALPKFPKFPNLHIKSTLLSLHKLNPFYQSPQTKLDLKLQKQYLFQYNREKARAMEAGMISCISENNREVLVNDSHTRIYFLSEIPDQFDSSFILGLLNSGLPLNFSYHIEGTDKANIIKSLRVRGSVLQAKQSERQKRGSDLDPHIEKERDELEYLIDKLVKGGQRSFNLGLNVTVSAPSLDKLHEYCYQFENITKQLELIFQPNTFRQKASLPSVMPLANNTVGEVTNLQTEAVVEMFPFLSKNIQDNGGFYIGTSLTNRNSLIIIDPFASHIHNANIVILGTSGSGKSVTSKSLLTKFTMRQIQCVILDPEGEYTSVTKQLGGENITFGVDDFGVNRGLNIFDLDFVSSEARRNHIAVLKNFFKFVIDERRYSDSDLDALLTEFYAAGDIGEGKSEKLALKKIKKSKTSQLTMQAFVALAKKHKLDFSKDLLKLTAGSLAGIFDSEERLNFDNIVINFDLSKLGNEDLKVPAMYLIGSIVDNLIDRADKKRMVFIDEAHLFLNRDFTREFYIRLQKTARKRRAGVVSITQNAEDYREDNGGKTILTQAETTFLLKQHPASVNFLINHQIFDLHDNEFKLLSNFEVGECIMFREKEHMLIKVNPLKSEWEFIQT
jgi:conjugal transfer ATP-binding protein TraC